MAAAPKNTEGLEPEYPRATMHPASSGEPSGAGVDPSVEASCSGGGGAVGLGFGVQSVAPIGDMVPAAQTKHSRDPGDLA